MLRQISQAGFGEIDGFEVIETVMQNANGMRFASCTYGATITEIAVPNREGLIENVVCSFNRVKDYKQNPHFFGSTIGPFAGRLENSELVIDGKVLRVKPNEGKHLLHGGSLGFHNALWTVETIERPDSLTTKYTLTYNQEFPGIIEMEVSFTLLETNEVVVAYKGFGSEDTYLNCTNHSYFNLSGNLKHSIHRHTLQLYAQSYIPIDEESLPLGEPIAVEGTHFDFSRGTTLQEVIGQNDAQIQLASGGLDHPFLLNNGTIVLTDEESGRRLTIVTQEPAVVIYTGNKIGVGYQFKNAPAQDFLGICLEEQNVPNSIKYPHYPSSLLKKGELYVKKTHYKFDVLGVKNLLNNNLHEPASN